MLKMRRGHFGLDTDFQISNPQSHYIDLTGWKKMQLFGSSEDGRVRGHQSHPVNEVFPPDKRSETYTPTSCPTELKSTA